MGKPTTETAGTVLFQPWTAEICLALAAHGVLRFTELKRSLAGISSRTLTARLGALRASGVVERKLYDEVPLRVEYGLTAQGTRLATKLLALVDALGEDGEPPDPTAPDQATVES